MTTHYQAGRDAYHAWAFSPACAQFDINAPAAVAAPFFLPPVEEANLQMSRPLPPDRLDWLRGFEDARRDAQS